MRIKIVWSGKTRDQNLKELQDSYLEKINKLERCELIETKEARGLTEGMEKRILAIEANGLEKHKMTFSHELTRVVLLEQIYSSLTIMFEKQYAK